MAYSEILRLSLRHAYFGSEAPPVTVRPTDLQDFERAGCLLRQRAAIIHVLADDTVEDRPDRVSLTLVATSQNLVGVTRGAVWGAPMAIVAPLGTDAISMSDGDAPTSPKSPRFLGAELATLDVALTDTGRRDLTLAFDAVESHWAYHLTGSRDLDGLEVIDSAGDIAFEDLGVLELPNGQAARVIRSAKALAARARPDQRFALQKPGPFGPETLVAVLPAAAPPFKPLPDAGASPGLQSDIFVTLW